jgi:hypothetical protein
VATVVSMLMAIGLAVIPYNFGSHRWSSDWTRTVRGVSLMMLVVLLPWVMLSMGIGASRTLVPVAMVLFCGAYAAGRMALWRKHPASRRRR